MSTLVVFAGPNGSGKSSIRDAIINPAEVVIDPDRIARTINPANPKAAGLEGGKEALRRFQQAIEQGRSVSMETTLTGQTAVMRMRQAKDAGYDVSLVYVALRAPDLNVERVQARVRQGGHDIDPDLIRKRVGTSMANLPRALAIADQAIVLDNSEKAYRTILETAAGRVTYQAAPLPGWLAAQLPGIVAALQSRAAAAAGSAELPAGPRSGVMLGVFEVLRRGPNPSPAPWEPTPTPMAERLAAFERATAEKAKPAPAPAPGPKDDPEPEQDGKPKPSSGPKP